MDIRLRREWQPHLAGDANGNATPTGGDGITTYGYDVLGRLASIGYSDATPDVTFTYDANDNRTQVTDGSGTETYAYDALNSLTNVAAAMSTARAGSRCGRGTTTTSSTTTRSARS